MRNNVDEMVKVYNQGKNGSLQNNYNSPKQLPMRAAGEYQSDSSSMREDYGKEGRQRNLSKKHFNSQQKPGGKYGLDDERYEREKTTF